MPFVRPHIDVSRQKVKTFPDMEIQTKLRTVAEVRRVFGNHVARQMWLLLGLPTVPGMFFDRQLDLFRSIPDDPIQDPANDNSLMKRIQKDPK